MSNTALRAIALLCLAGATVLGCSEPLKDAQRIEGPRVLGVRVTTPNGQASLEPAQAANFEVLLADRDGPMAAHLAYELCNAAKSARGVPYCEGTVLGEGRSELSAELGGNAVAVELPKSLPRDPSLVFLGLACQTGSPRLAGAALKWKCSDSSAPLRFSFDVSASSAEAKNANPDLSSLRVSVGGVAIALDDPMAPPSCAADAATVSLKKTHEVHISLGRPAREAGADELRSTEALQLSHFATRGLFERHFSFVTAEQKPEVDLQWTAPSRSYAVKQYLVARDGRGGVSWVSWSFCAR